MPENTANPHTSCGAWIVTINRTIQDRKIGVAEIERTKTVVRGLVALNHGEFMYDPELPNGFQDADIDLHELTAQANREHRLRKRGICAHGWLQCPPGPPNKPTTIVTCKDCGKTFNTEQEAYDERRELLI